MKKVTVKPSQRRRALARKLFIDRIAKKRRSILEPVWTRLSDKVAYMIGIHKADLTGTSEALSEDDKARILRMQDTLEQFMDDEIAPDLESAYKTLASVNGSTFTEYFATELGYDTSTDTILATQQKVADPARIAQKVTNATDKTKAQFQEVITKGFEEGKSFDAITADIMAVAELPVKRVETIVKNETVSQAQEVNAELAQDAGLSEKMWIHAGGGKTNRPEHEAMDGVVVPINEPFYIEGDAVMYPHDPDAPIEQTANCYCQVEYS